MKENNETNMAENQTESNDADEFYDPYKYRPRKISVSDIGSFSNMVKSIAGTGLFAMPYAFSNVGLLFGIVGTILMGFIITLSLHFLLKIHYIMCTRVKRPMLKYNEIVAIIMTTGIMKGKVSYEIVIIIVDTIMLICYMGIGAVYVVFIAGTVQECLDVEKTVGKAYYALVLVPFFLILNMVRGLRAIAPLSAIGNVFLIIACVIGFFHAFKDHPSHDWTLIQSNVKLYPKFLSIVFFALCSPGLILAIEHSMKHPWNYSKSCGILNWGMGSLVMIHVVVGSIGYYIWGNATLNNFILNYHDLDAIIIIALILQALAIFFTYGLQCYVPIAILYEEYVGQSIKDGYLKGTPYLWDIIVRITVTLITCTFAAAIPQLHLYTNFIGSFCIATLGFILPMTLFIITNYGNFGNSHWKLSVSLFTITIGLIIMICTTTSSVIAIVHYIKE